MDKKIKTTEKFFRIDVDKNFYLNLILDHEILNHKKKKDELIKINIGFEVFCGRDEVSYTLPINSIYNLLNVAKIEFAKHKKQLVKAADTRKASEAET